MIQHLGRFRLGDYLPVFHQATADLVPVELDRAIPPTYDVRAIGTGNLVETGELWMDRTGNETTGGPWIGKVFLDSSYSAGRYVVMVNAVEWDDGTPTCRVSVAMFDVIPTGNANGPITAMSVIERADRTVYLMYAESGQYRQSLNPGHQ